MISIQKQFLFIHVPKTGGNSIQNILRNYSEDDIVILTKHQDGFERFEVCNRKYNITKHSNLSHYKSVLETDIYQSLFKFATIRNPWDMMISFYFSPHRGVTEFKRNQFLALLSGVPPLRYYICEAAQPALQPLGALGLGLVNPMNDRPKPLDSDIDFLIRFEHLDHDFKLVCEKLDIPYSPLPKCNQSSHDHYAKYYDEELKTIVGAKFREEIDFGNYTFENKSCA